MRFLALIAAVCSTAIASAQSPDPTAKPSSAITQQVQPTTPSEAIAMFGAPEIVVRMQVKQAKNRLAKRGIIFLDSEAAFDDPRNLGVALSAKVAEEFKQQGVLDLASHLSGRTIEVTGCVMQFEQRIYMPVLSSQQLKIIPFDQ